ncbi:MAG: type II toxin-antitoxin system Phd/YefM family antitoxin, partial [Candidatus Methylomirabilia bacterium]
MAAAGIRALKNLLSQYLKRVRAGERLVVTERREPVAIISPLAVVQLPAKCPLGVVNCASW